MTTYETAPIDFDAVSEPISGETRAVVWSAANNWRSAENWAEFRHACYAVAVDGVVDPNVVRERLTNRYGLTIEPAATPRSGPELLARTAFLTPMAG